MYIVQSFASCVARDLLEIISSYRWVMAKKKGWCSGSKWDVFIHFQNYNYNRKAVFEPYVGTLWNFICVVNKWLYNFYSLYEIYSIYRTAMILNMCK